MAAKASKEEIEKARELRSGGMGFKAIGEALGRSLNWAQKVTKGVEKGVAQAESEAQVEPEAAQEPVAAEPEPEPTGKDETLRPASDDPRPKAWLEILAAKAGGDPVPRHVRVFEDERFTGTRMADKTKALMVVGIERDKAAKLILRAEMIERRGEKHCNW